MNQGEPPSVHTAGGGFVVSKKENTIMNEQVMKVLTTPFPKDLIKSRRGAGGQQFAYVEIAEVIQRLNDAFAHEWNFEIVSRDIVEDQVVVHGRLSALGCVKEEIGGAMVTRRTDDGTAMSIADDVKVAASDCVKRCARLFGLGLDLWRDDQAEQPARSSTKPASVRRSALKAVAPAPSGRTRIGAAQLARLLEMAKERRLDERAFRERVRQRFGRNVEYLSVEQAEEVVQLLEQSAQPTSHANGHAGARP
jgi:hypothetical protein